jgi:hypothetical protein
MLVVSTSYLRGALPGPLRGVDGALLGAKASETPGHRLLKNKRRPSLFQRRP